MDPAIIIPLAGMATGVVIVTMALKHAERKARLRAGLGSEDTARLTAIVDDLQKETASLRSRVAVLEKLVTDDDRNLAGEIEKLRRRDDVTTGA
ncbi:MAG: hypothetical protein GC155_02705 [Alphaproteobacteria bacterium]|nr:hypothetical protein [Alphaproteobacteria bacterium]